MTLDLPYPWIEDEALQANFDRIKTEWPEPASAWQDFTATVSATSVTLGTGGTNLARYAKQGRTVTASGLITLGTGGAFTGTECLIALPLAAASSMGQIGTAAASDNSTGFVYPGSCVVNASGSTVFFRFVSGSNTPLGATTPFTWAVSDALYWQITYETAV